MTPGAGPRLAGWQGRRPALAMDGACSPGCGHGAAFPPGAARAGWRSVEGGREQRAPPPASREDQPEGPGVRAIPAAPLALEGWTGKGAKLPQKPRRSRADDGQRKPGWGACDPPGRSAGRWRNGPWATSAEAASCGGTGCRHIFARDGSCPDGPGHGEASVPGYCRGPVAERQGTMGRYSRAMARACQPPGANLAGVRTIRPLPCPAPDLEASTVGRYSRATPRTSRTDRACLPGVRAIPPAPLASRIPASATPPGLSHVRWCPLLAWNSGSY